MKPLKSHINDLVLKIFNKKDPVLAVLIINWKEIIGSRFGNKTFPVRITSKKSIPSSISTLYIIAETSSVSTELLFEKNKIIERITVYLGYKAVHQLRIIVSNLVAKNDL